MNHNWFCDLLMSYTLYVHPKPRLALRLGKKKLLVEEDRTYSCGRSYWTDVQDA